MSSKTTGPRAIGLHELGWRCVHDSHYAPEMNSDAGPLFLLYPSLYQRHGTGIWCKTPGLAALWAWRELVSISARATPRDAAAAIGACFTDTALVALCDVSDADHAGRTVLQAAREEYEAMRDPIRYERKNQAHDDSRT